MASTGDTHSGPLDGSVRGAGAGDISADPAAASAVSPSPQPSRAPDAQALERVVFGANGYARYVGEGANEGLVYHLFFAASPDFPPDRYLASGWIEPAQESGDE